MIRSFGVALVTTFVVVLSTSYDRIAAQPNAPPSQLPVQITGATPGINLELFLNAGKVADVTISTTGDGSSVLDLSNLGKVQLQVYVDVCQDGKVVKVMVVSGQPAPEDTNCRRRVVGSAWWSDCGATRLTLDVTRFGMRVVGCGSLYTEPKFYGPVGGAIVVGGLLIAGGGDGTTTASSSPPTSTAPPATTPPVAPPPVTPPPVTPPTNTTTPVVPVDFGVTLQPGYTHPGGNTSLACFAISAAAIGNAPALNTSATYSGQIQGPGVVSGGTFSGNLNSAGRAVVQAVINSVGNYVANVTVIFGGVTRTATSQVNVTQNQSNCPQ
jgi:hypothetical protein